MNLETLESYLAGRFVGGEGAPLQSLNPANGALLGEGKYAKEENLTLLCHAATKGQALWSKTPLEERIEHLFALKEAINREKESLALALSMDTGKTLWEAHGELSAALAKFDLTIAAKETRQKEGLLDESAGLSISYRPHGVCLVIAPFNFPIHLALGHIIPALLAGNSVILKPSDKTAMVTSLLFRLIASCSFPDGVLQMILATNDMVASLLQHDAIDALFFTGSYKVGRLLEKIACLKRNKLCALELGGNNPLILGALSDRKEAIVQIIVSSFITTGQRCSCARRLIVVSSKKNRQLVDELTAKLSDIAIGSYDKTPEPFMGPLIDLDAKVAFQKGIEQRLSLGGKFLSSGSYVEPEGCFVRPVLIDMTSAKGRVDEEVFAPLLECTFVDDLSDAIKAANDTNYGLTAGIISSDEREVEEALRELKAGVVNANCPLTGASSKAPFGGIKNSGNYRPSGFHAIDYCAYPVAHLVKKEVKEAKKTYPGLNL